jgi:hypothetical protein
MVIEMLLSLLVQALRDLHAAIIKELRRRAEKDRKEEALSKYGWDCNCPGCKGLMHTNDLVVAVHETDMHWHYLCKCGFRSAWLLDGPVPRYDSSYVYKTVPPVL